MKFEVYLYEQCRLGPHFVAGVYHLCSKTTITNVGNCCFFYILLKINWTIYERRYVWDTMAMCSVSTLLCCLSKYLVVWSKNSDLVLELLMVCAKFQRNFLFLFFSLCGFGSILVVEWIFWQFWFTAALKSAY